MGGITSLGVHPSAGYSPAMLRSIARAKAAAILVPITAALLLSGCATFGKKKGETPYVARDVESLYIEAKEQLDKGNYKVAGALFDEVERQHPYSEWARRAEIMGAFTYYLQRDYNKAIDGAQRFLSIHPGNREAPYATYLIALCYYEQIADVDRDQKITQEALDALNEVIRRYPQSEYAADSKLKIDLVNDHLAGKEMEIGRYYERAGLWLAAQIRFQIVIDKYQTTSHTAEALYRLTETNLALGIPDQAKKYAAVLGANYPGSPWYQRAYNLLGKKEPQLLKS
jgi:outer membrane protein assembly factor BamD